MECVRNKASPGNIGFMTETPDNPTAPTPIAAPPPTQRGGPSRLAQVALWVAIVAGSVFIVSAVFFSGFVVGKHSGGYGRFHHDRDTMMFHKGQMMPGMMPGMMGPGGPMRPDGPRHGRPPGPEQPSPPPPPPAPRP